MRMARAFIERVLVSGEQRTAPHRGLMLCSARALHCVCLYTLLDGQCCWTTDRGTRAFAVFGVDKDVASFRCECRRA